MIVLDTATGRLTGLAQLADSSGEIKLDENQLQALQELNILTANGQGLGQSSSSSSIATLALAAAAVEKAQVQQSSLQQLLQTAQLLPLTTTLPMSLTSTTVAPAAPLTLNTTKPGPATDISLFQRSSSANLNSLNFTAAALAPGSLTGASQALALLNAAAAAAAASPKPAAGAPASSSAGTPAALPAQLPSAAAAAAGNEGPAAAAPPPPRKRSHAAMHAKKLEASGDEGTTDDKLRVRREKNRLAARKCRARKAAALQDLEQQVQELLTQHQAMHSQLQGLRSTLKKLIGANAEDMDGAGDGMEEGGAAEGEEL